MRIAHHFSLIPQFLILIAFWLMGEAVARYCHIPLPGGVIGMILLLAALLLRIVPVRFVEGGSNLLLKEMLLFFIPAILVILDHPEFLGFVGVKIVGIIIVSTLIVMSATGATIETLSKRNQKEGTHDGAK